MNNLQDIIDRARDQAAQAIADEQEDLRETISELPWLLRQFPAWKRWYLKKNQPTNYFRVTCYIAPGLEDTPFLWLCNFQIWAKGRLDTNLRITAEAYQFFSTQPVWKQSSHNPDHYLYHPQKP